MPKVKLTDSEETVTLEGFEGHYSELAHYTVGLEKYHADADLRDLLRGLPDDLCQSPHWGYVVKGKLIYHFADHDEEISEGEAYYTPPGHSPELTAGTEVIEFSPTEELQRTIEVATKNAASG